MTAPAAGRSRRDVLEATAIGAVGVACVPGLAAGHSSGSVSCETIDEPGTYRLDEELDGSANCLTVTAPDVVLEGQGHRIVGHGEGAGIAVHADGVTIRDVTVTGFARGIAVSNADGLSLENVEVHDNGMGVDAELGSALSMIDSRIDDNEQHGILVALWDGLTVEDAEIRGNGGSGIATDEGWGLSVIDSTIEGNERGLIASPGDELRGNTIADNATHGVDVDPFPQPPFPDEVTLLENDIRENGETGILVRLGMADVSGNAISGNRIGVAVSDRYDGGPEWRPDAIVTGNRIENNDVAGLTNDVDREIDATCNWWGAPSGPMHPDSPKNDPGGDGIEGDASFVPWRTESDGACDGGVTGLTVDITADPEEASIDESITVSYTVRNRGDASQSGTVSLEVADQEVEETDVELPAGEETDGTFEYEPSEADVGELRLSVTMGDVSAETLVVVAGDSSNGADDGTNASDDASHTTGDQESPADAASADDDVIPGFGVLGTLLTLVGVGSAVRERQRRR